MLGCRGWWIVAVVVICSGGASLGCSLSEPDDDDHEADETRIHDALEDRWAHRYLPRQRGWVRESEIPPPSEAPTSMVIWEQSVYLPDVLPTPEQERAAEELVERCYAAAERHGWYDFDKGAADGFERIKDDGRHFRNTGYMLDDRILDPDRPENLMYYPTPTGKYALAGFMFFVRSRDEWGPQIGGPLTLWHYHIWKRKRCFIHDLITVAWAKNDECEEGVGLHRSGEMMHVWLIDHPRGPFATSMLLPKHIVAEGVMKRRRERGF
jgi:hypothetical protein